MKNIRITLAVLFSLVIVFAALAFYLFKQNQTLLAINEEMLHTFQMKHTLAKYAPCYDPQVKKK